MKRLYSLQVMVMLLTSSFIIGLNENFVKTTNPSALNYQVFTLRTCDNRTVYYEGEDICLEIVLNNPYDTPLEFDDMDFELGAVNVNNSTLATTLLISIFYEINSTVYPPNSYGILFDRISYPIDSRWINGTYNFYFILLNSPEFYANLILDIVTSNNTNLSNKIDYGYNVMSMTTNKPVDQPYGYLILRDRVIWWQPIYFQDAKYKFHFVIGTDDMTGESEFDAVREAVREWNNLIGFTFKIEEESKPWLESPFICFPDFHSHISWKHVQYPIPSQDWDPCLGSKPMEIAARTWLFVVPFTGIIFDADIVFNDSLPEPWTYSSVKRVALHELGHVISLDDLYNKSDLVGDIIQIMHSGYRIEWGDKAGARWMYPAIYNVESIWFGWETAESDATIGYIDYNSRPDLIVAWIDNPSGPNWIYYKIGWNLDQDGYASSWSSIRLIPDSIGDDTPGLAIALTNLDSNPRPDLFVAWLERNWWVYPDKIYYRVGWNLDIYGIASSWSSIRSIDLYAPPNYYLGIAIYDFNRNNRLDIVFVTWGPIYIHGPFYIKYKIGWDMNPDLSFSSISSEVLVTAQDQIAGLGASVIMNPDLDKNNIPEIIIAYMWDGAWPLRQNNRIEYVILWNFNYNGQYSSWERKLGPFYPYISGYGWHTQGVGVTVFDLNRDPNSNTPRHEFIFVWMDNPYGENKMYYVIEWESRVWSHP
ncbi:MAG: hypothetical protein RQ952_04985 [Thermoproteota archaeon]|nr:hypothetical protein [Thermoproteota archaeon]